MIRLALATSLMALTGCMTSAEASSSANEEASAEAKPDEATDQEPMYVLNDRPGAQCNAEAAQMHVGDTATEEVGATILAKSGAKRLRWGPPRAAWSMDIRPDRVNVRYNENSTITSITCG